MEGKPLSYKYWDGVRCPRLFDWLASIIQPKLEGRQRASDKKSQISRRHGSMQSSVFVLTPSSLWRNRIMNATKQNHLGQEAVLRSLNVARGRMTTAAIIGKILYIHHLQITYILKSMVSMFFIVFRSLRYNTSTCTSAFCTTHLTLLLCNVYTCFLFHIAKRAYFTVIKKPTTTITVLDFVWDELLCLNLNRRPTDSGTTL